MTREVPTLCAWCGRPFQERQTGGRAQRFCLPSCRRAFHTAVRAWAVDAIADGTLTVAEVRNGAPATRALVTAAPTGVPGGEVASQRLTPAGPCADGDHTGQRDLERLMARAIAMRRR